MNTGFKVLLHISSGPKVEWFCTLFSIDKDVENEKNQKGCKTHIGSYGNYVCSCNYP